MKEQENKSQKRDLFLTLGTLFAIAAMTIKGCQEIGDRYKSEQAALDRLCGKDRSGCVASTERVIVPHFDGSASGYDTIVYSTPTPSK